MKRLRKYLITMLIGLAAVAWILWSKDIYSQTEAVTIFHILCDAFFAVGVVILCIGLLIFSTNEGTFDIIVYGVSTFFGMFKKNHVRKYDTFYDYRVSRADKKVKFGYLLICGLILLAVSMVMYLMYRQYK